MIWPATKQGSIPDGGFGISAVFESCFSGLFEAVVHERSDRYQDVYIREEV